MNTVGGKHGVFDNTCGSYSFTKRYSQKAVGKKT